MYYTIKEFQNQLWNKIKRIIDNLINVSWINEPTREMITYQLESGGKKIRPAIATGVHFIYDGKQETILPFAGSVELIHNASLVHDDIQDRDETRRGRLSAWRKYSIGQAINLGDILFSLAFELFDLTPVNHKLKLEIVRRTIRAVGELVNGQVLEIVFKDQGRATFAEYCKMVSGKTGSLFRLALCGGYLLAKSDANSFEIPPQITELGTSLGLIFQLRDDLLDFIGEKEGRPIYSDIIEGKISSLSAMAFDLMSEEERQNLSILIKNTAKKNNEKTVEQIAQIYRKLNCMDKVKRIFDREKKKILENRVVISNPALKKMMKEVLQYLDISAKLHRIS